jgi:tetrahydromethanopterin S-methyltransferase subunit G
LGSEVKWKQLIAEALDYEVEASDIDEIEKNIESGNCQLWQSENSAIVTEGMNLQSGGIGVKVLAAAGDLTEIVGLLGNIEQEARASGVELLTTIGRKGWKQTAKKIGWTDVATVYAKRLS